MIAVKRLVGPVVFAAGLAASLHSLRETAGHVEDPTYRELSVPQGSGHVAYHLSREAFSTAGALAASVPAGIGALRGHRTAWAALATSVSGYLAGQWSGKRTAGAFAPTGGALAWHVATTALLVAGAALLFPSGPAERVARR